MATPISPWSAAADVVSPDGRYRAVIAEAIEVGMGAPTSGTLVISDNQGGRTHVRVESCNPSIVWSSDSRTMAFPQWTPDRQQRLCVVSFPGGVVRSLDENFRVLELHSLEGGIVRGIDSPVYMPRGFERPVEDLIERGLH
jgi:hypothetical protein